jgi:hypothetical protein
LASSGYHAAKMQENIFIFWFTNATESISQLDKIFCLLLFEATFTSFFKDKKSKRVTK